MKKVHYLILIFIMSTCFSCAGGYEDEGPAKSTREIRKEMLKIIERNFKNGKSYFFKADYKECQSHFDYILEYKKYDSDFYSDSITNFYKQNLRIAIDNQALQFVVKISKQFYLYDYIKFIDSIKTAKQDSINIAKKELEKKDRKWVFYNSGYYDMTSDPQNSYLGTDYVYLWYDENSIMKEGDFIYVMCKFSYYSTGSCPTYQYLQYDNNGNRKTIDLYHSCKKLYTGVHYWDDGQINQEFFNLIISKLE